MKDFLTNSVFFGAMISLVAYEMGTILKKKFKLAIFKSVVDCSHLRNGGADSVSY